MWMAFAQFVVVRLNRSVSDGSHCSLNCLEHTWKYAFSNENKQFANKEGCKASCTRFNYNDTAMTAAATFILTISVR